MSSYIASGFFINLFWANEKSIFSLQYNMLLLILSLYKLLVSPYISLIVNLSTKICPVHFQQTTFLN